MIPGIPETLLAKVPDHLASGLEQGLLKLNPSGALRYTNLSGRHPGGLAGWIQPTQAEGDLGGLLKSATGSLQGLAAAASVVNIGVSVVGFAVVCHKLNQIQGQLKGIEKGIQRIENRLEEIQQELRGLRSDLSQGFRELREELDTWFHLDMVAQFNAILTDPGARYSDARGDQLRAIFDKALHVAERKIRQGRFETACTFHLMAINVAGFLLHLQAAAGQGERAVKWIQDPRVMLGLETIETQLAWGFLSRRPNLMKDRLPEPVLEGALGGVYRHRGIAWGERLTLAERTYDWGPAVRGRTDQFGDLKVPLVLDAESGVQESVPNLIADANWQRFIDSCALPAGRALSVSSAIDNLRLQQEILEVCPKAINLELDNSRPLQLISVGV